MELKHITEPLLEAKDEFARILIDNTRDALNRGMDKVQKARIDSEGLLEYSQWVSDNLREHYFTASQRTLERIAGDIMNNIQQSYEEGLGYREASQRLEQVFTNMQTYELERIARTELGRAESLGMYTSEIELGVEYHQWSTMEDDLVRDSHSDLEGQIVRVGDEFSNGLKYPLDTSGDISEWINCRCVLLPYIMPEGFTAPDLPYFYEYDLIPISTTESIQEEAIQSLAKYQHTDFFPINQYLRAGRLPEDTLQTKQDIKKMDSLMQPLKQDTLLYRGMGHNLLDKIGITLNENLDEVLNGRIEGKTYSEYLNEKLSGVVFQDNGFISTSSDLETAKDFVTWTKTLSNQTKGLMEITAQAGVKAINVDDLNYMGESEYILQRGTKFMIDRVEIIENRGKLLIKYKVKVVE